ncbi:alpha-amylase family glycosyl hydrolase [Rhodospirillaceae bacterium SYSU D60014]|uniref:alpha-amylase family glycosyl hydrolase n=1 Tax=Virgifigura deserti TaxID=2268457 RepID=UPI000E667FFF
MTRLLRSLGPLAALFVGACATPDTTLSLESTGGDAWTFEKRIEGTLTGACNDIVVTAPGGTVPAWRDGTHFSAVVELQEGANEVRAVCQSNDASAAQHWTVQLRDRPKAWIRTVVTSAGTKRGLILDAGRSEPAPARAVPIVRYEWRARPDNPAPLYAAGSETPLDAAPTTGKQLALEPQTVDGAYYVTLRAVDALGRADESTAVFRVRDGEARAVNLAREHPAWVDEAVIYGVVPFFFGPRGFDDVTARLDEIAALGATVLWLSPITDAPEDDFGYAVTDPFEVRERFGTEADLRALVNAAHARGLRVVMDFIPNHFSDEHAYYVDVASRGEASPYFDFFDRDETGEVTTYFNWENLKNLNYDNSEVQRYVIEAFAHWVRDLGIDGFRVDVSWGVHERAPEFWPRWRAELKRIDPDLLLLAEASARDPYYVANGFDAAYDWTNDLGKWAWFRAFEDRAHTAAHLRAALTNDGAGRPPDTLIFRFMNNNDTGARFITRYGIGRTRVAAAMLLTLPGIPGIYTGDEVGAAFEPYAEGPPITWEDPHGLRPYYTRLISLRQAEPALRTRDLQLVETSHGETVLAYLRPGPSPDESLLVLLNYGETPVRASLSRTDEITATLGSGQVIDLLSGETLTVSPDAPILPLPAFGARVLQSMPPG